MQNRRGDPKQGGSGSVRRHLGCPRGDPSKPRSHRLVTFLATAEFESLERIA